MATRGLGGPRSGRRLAEKLAVILRRMPDSRSEPPGPEIGPFKLMKATLPAPWFAASGTVPVWAATSPRAGRPAAGRLGFSLTEVIVAMAMITLTFAGVIYGYLRTADRAEWSAYSLAAQSLAMQGIEQVRGAKWDPQAWPVVDDLGVTNFTQVEALDVPVAGEPVLATNYISVTTISVNPPLRQLRADCVWMLRSRRAAIAGPFTNTAVTLRAADQ